MGYRTDTEVLKHRVAEIEEQLRDIAEKSRQAEELRSREADLRRELAEAAGRLRLRSLPLLDKLQVAAPCKASWDDMIGDDRVRFCGACEKNVYNLSAMTRAAAEDLLREKEGRLCTRFYRRADGTVMTTDCPIGTRRRKRRRLALALVGGGAMAAASAAALLTHRMGETRATVGEFKLTEYKGAVATPVPMGDVGTPKEHVDPHDAPRTPPIAPSVLPPAR